MKGCTEKNGNPRDTECYYNAGLALAYMGERARAEDMFAKWLWGDNAHRAMAELTCLALTGGQAEKALYYAEKCAQTDMTDMRAVNALARILRDGGEDSIADVFVSSVLQTDPINAEAAFAAGRNDILRRISGAEARDCAATLMREGRYPAAYEFLKKYRRLKGGAEAMTYLYLAHAAKATGRAYKKYLCAAVEAPVSFARTLWDRQTLLPLCGESFFVSYQLGCMEYDAGNVDKADKYWMGEVYENSQYGLYHNGPFNIGGVGNYAVNLTKDGQPYYSVIMMDSNRVTQIDGVNEYGSFTPSQVLWYEWLQRGLIQAGYEHSLMFFHIPFEEYRLAYEEWEAGGFDENVGFGVKEEDVCCAPYNPGMFTKIKELGATTHTFAGHDHVNAYSVDYQGVRLTYGLKSSRQFYYSEELVGGTLITLKGDTGNVSVDIEYKYVQL